MQDNTIAAISTPSGEGAIGVVRISGSNAFAVAERVETEIKYSGYIERQMAQVKELERLEGRILPETLDYDEIKGLRLEAVEKLKKVKPSNIGQASRISGVSPADITVLLIHLEKIKGENL